MRASAIAVLALPVLAAATAVPRDDGDCNTGTVNCCNSTQTNSVTSAALLGGLLGLVIPVVSGLIGLGCSPLSVLSAAGLSCSSQPVCCTNNSFNGIIAVGCTPININV